MKTFTIDGTDLIVCAEIRNTYFLHVMNVFHGTGYEETKILCTPQGKIWSILEYTKVINYGPGYASLRQKERSVKSASFLRYLEDYAGRVRAKTVKTQFRVQAKKLLQWFLDL